MSQYITLSKRNPHSYSVSWQHGPEIGRFIQSDDGLFYFSSNTAHGLWSSHSLREISEELDRINRPFEQQMERDLKRWARRDRRRQKVAEIWTNIKNWFKQ